jgi:hypothetical protein
VKQVIFFVLIVAFPALLWAQSHDTAVHQKDTAYQISDPVLQTKPVDTTIFVPIVDTVARQKRDTTMQSLLSQNKLLNTSGTPVSLVVKLKKNDNNDMLFYLLTAMVLLLACLKFFYNRYFTNLFRVFFNTSLRQSQLTDQLLQAKLPSLLFNLFFIISAGFYVYLLLLHYKWVNETDRWLILACCVGVLSLIYVIKFCTLKFTGWITGFAESTNTYVFIIFLINKIIGIFLVPLTIIIAFAMPSIANSAVLISMLCVGFLLLMRFFRSYGLIQHQLKISRLHFFLYITGVEILPLLLIYKALILLLNKNL